MAGWCKFLIVVRDNILLILFAVTIKFVVIDWMDMVQLRFNVEKKSHKYISIPNSWVIILHDMYYLFI